MIPPADATVHDENRRNSQRLLLAAPKPTLWSLSVASWLNFLSETFDLSFMINRNYGILVIESLKNCWIAGKNWREKW